MSGNGWEIERKKQIMHRERSKPGRLVPRSVMGASTFREDPLPDWPFRKRPGITMPKFKCLED